MKQVGELLPLFKEKSFGELIQEKKNNFKIRAGDNENIIYEFNSGLDGFYNIVKYFDEKNIELKQLLTNNPKLEISEIDYSRIKDIINKYNGLINQLENFKEGEPDINGILNSSQYRQLQQFILQLQQNNNNQGIQIEKYNNEIDNILNNLKITILFYEKTELKNELSEAKKIGDEILNKKSEIDEALKVTESILEKKNINIQNEIKEHYEFFEKEAENNIGSLIKGNGFKSYFFPKNYKSFKIIWLLLSIITGILTSIYIFIVFQDKNLSIGDSLLRISILTIAFYFIVFFSKQYSNHKNLYKSYTFKAISLKIMLGLSKIGSVSEKNMIYEKALDKIFSEPNVNLNNSKDGDIINIIKDSIPAKIQTNIKDTN